MFLAGFGLYESTNFLGYILGYGHPIDRIDQNWHPDRRIVAWQNWYPVGQFLVCTIIVTYVVPFVFNLFVSKRKAAKKVATKNGDFFKLLIQQAVDNNLPVELSLLSGKSYVGFVESFRIVIENPSVKKFGDDVVLMPTLSGYRKEETRELVFTTNYSSIYLKKFERIRVINNIKNIGTLLKIRKLGKLARRIIRPKLLKVIEELELKKELKKELIEELDGNNYSDLHIGISMSEIISVRLFDKGIYDRFQNTKESV